MKLTLRCFTGSVCLTASICCAQFGVRWDHVPTVVVVGAEGDPRHALVDESILFWNKTLEELGSGLRLPPATHSIQAVPEEALRSLSQTLMDRSCQTRAIPPALRSLPGDLTVVLGGSDLVSFTGPFFESGSRRIVGIRPMSLVPMSLPNVARNVIIHELGHAIGLGHNNDPSTLMCGRPAPCRPDGYQSDVPRVFPLTDYEKRQLRAMYPAQWNRSRFVSSPRTAAAKQKRTYLIGALWMSPCPDPFFHTLLRELRNLGYVEGQNLSIVHRSGQPLSGNAAELVALKPDLILAMGTPPAMAVQRLTTTLPVVFWDLVDPVEAGLVTSLARPQGNLTGVTAITPEQSGKRLELLKAAVPKAARVGVLWNPADQFAKREFDFMNAAAAGLGLQLQSLEVRNPSELEAAFSAARRAGVDAVSVLASPFIALNMRRVIDLALLQHMPAIFWSGAFARGGGLMAYGPAQHDTPRNMATMVDKILQGTKPSEVPVEQPTRYELIVNKATASFLGITIPNSVLMLADEVID